MPGGDPAAEQQRETDQQPVALDPAFLAEEIRRRNRATRREQERQRGQERDNSNSNGIQAFALLSTSPSSYSRAFLTRLLNRGSTPSEADQPSSSITAATDRGKPGPSPTIIPGLVTTTTSACDSDGDEEEEDDENDGEMDMLDLFGARDRDFDRMTGLTSAESAVGFDDDDDDDEEEESSEDDDDDREEGDEDEDEDDDDEEEEEDILLLGHR
jgi:tyrosyl-DNA phosphodiesterase 2